MKNSVKQSALVLLVTLFTLFCVVSIVACSPATPNKDSSSQSEPHSSSVLDSSLPDSSLPDSSSTPEEPPVQPGDEFISVSGKLAKTATGYNTIVNNTLAVKNGGEFSQGTLAATIKLSGSGGDNGIIFGLKNTSNLEHFWEHAGVHYYFFFLSRIGTAYLGKVTDTSWIVCGEAPIPNFDDRGEYTLEVARDKTFEEYDLIRCYVNGELFVTYKDSNHTDGTGYGVRAAMAGVVYTNISTREEILGAATAIDGYIVTNGSFSQSDGTLVSETPNSLAEKTDGEFIYGTLEATIALNGNNADNGIVFALTPNELHSYWEGDVSYYFFFLSFSGFAYLGKVDNGSWTECQITPLPNYSASQTYNLKVERDNTTINCYVNGVNYITYVDAFPLSGTGYGLRAGAKGVAYSNIKCWSVGEIVETFPDDITTVSGKFTGHNGAVKSGGRHNVALLNDKSLAEGSFNAKVKGVSDKRAGLIFAYSDENGVESYYRFVTRKEAQRVEVDLVAGDTITNVYSNYLSAGYSQGAEINFNVILKEGIAYCYFGEILYTHFPLQLSGTGVGLYAEGASAQFRAYQVSADAQPTTVDTLLFGHSYFELWSNYKNDLSALAEEYQFGTYLNIGIGGSIASHWEKFKESLAVYNADRVIYMIGINDLTGGTSPASIVASIDSTLKYLKEWNSDLEVILLSVNHCPARSNIRSTISQTNILMQQLCAQNDWIFYAEMEYAFCDNGSTPNSYWFTDGLHPTANGYVKKIVPAINNALDNLNQPSADADAEAKLLENAKNLKKSVLIDYSEWSYRSSEWAIAKPYYEQAIAAIDACTTVDAVNALDLTSLLTNLKAIKSNTDYFYADMISSNNCTAWETPIFAAAMNSSKEGTFAVEHDGHRVVEDRAYTDMSFTFCLSDITADFDTVGVLFRAKQTSTLGIQGYMINIVTEENYIQIWYFNGAFGQSGGTLEYIGGWVFLGEVEETLFRVVVENNTCYVYTEEDYQSKGKESYGCSVDLSFGGKYTPWASGGLGVLCWNSANGAKGNLLIGNVSGNIKQ